MVKVEAPAKINLCLAVTGKEGSMHRLDGVFCSVPFLADEVVLEKADDVTVRYTDGRAYENDTALRMARAIARRYGVGAKITIEKRIPEGAGLGGSSVDAAAVARGMRDLYGLPEIDVDLLLSIGSDVPYCYVGGNGRVRGIGECVEPVSLPPLYFVVLVPIAGVNTAKCYALYDEIGGEEGSVDDFLRAARDGRIEPFNALGRAAATLNDDVRKGLELLREAGFHAGVSGSGCATFGVETNGDDYEKKRKKLSERAHRFRVYAWVE